MDDSAKLTGLNAIVLAGMAGTLPFTANVEIEGAVRPGANLTWKTPENAGNLSGYRVHWRLMTEPEAYLVRHRHAFLGNPVRDAARRAA
ncbi:hypothetical protein [uncultured Algimonas sp.]|uniref:hypothetical protein n=1 Tax=uncultured Algimonas sp. TaxID=1547920 RepID=UPI002621E63F|nr:hypothetical protein [uncultured Algimonas sp.]